MQEQRAAAGNTQAPADVGVPAPKRFVGPSGDPRFAVWGWCDGHVGDKYRLGEELEKNGDSVWCGAVVRGWVGEGRKGFISLIYG